MAQVVWGREIFFDQTDASEIPTDIMAIINQPNPSPLTPRTPPPTEIAGVPYDQGLLIIGFPYFVSGGTGLGGVDGWLISHKPTPPGIR